MFLSFNIFITFKKFQVMLKNIRSAAFKNFHQNLFLNFLRKLLYRILYEVNPMAYLLLKDFILGGGGGMCIYSEITNSCRAPCPFHLHFLKIRIITTHYKRTAKISCHQSNLKRFLSIDLLINYVKRFPREQIVSQNKIEYRL